jgi:hypothetical protein
VGNVYPGGAAAVRRPGIGEDGAKWIASKDPGLVLWEFHDSRDNPIGSLEAHNLIFAIGLCLVDDCLLGPASSTLKAAGTSSSHRHTRTRSGAGPGDRAGARPLLPSPIRLIS